LLAREQGYFFRILRSPSHTIKNCDHFNVPFHAKIAAPLYNQPPRVSTTGPLQPFLHAVAPCAGALPLALRNLIRLRVFQPQIQAHDLAITLSHCPLRDTLPRPPSTPFRIDQRCP